jgi:hypothetical protein
MGNRGFDQLHARHSARLKNLYIELIDYSYFHSPSELGNLDKRFTGRREVLDRLKLLLTDHETPAGAYLITGYRGAGKSSLVAQALADISPRQNFGNRLARYARLLVLLTPFTLLGPFLLGSVWLLVPLLGLLAIFLLAWLLWGRDRDQLSYVDIGDWPAAWAYLKEGLSRIGAAWKKWLLVEGEKSPHQRYLLVVHDLFLALVLGYTASLAASLTKGDLFQRAVWLLSLFFALALANLVVMAFQAAATVPKTQHQEKIRLRQRLRRTLWPLIKNYFSYPNRVPIKINLSQNNIQERDILRMISKSIETSYSHFLSEFKFDLPWKLVKAVVVIGFVATLFNVRSSRSFLEGLALDLHLPCALPSQGAFLLNNGGSVKYQRIREDLLTDGTYTAENLVRELEGAVKPSGLGEGHDGHFFTHDFARGVLGIVGETSLAALIHFDTAVQTAYHSLQKHFLTLGGNPDLSGSFSANVTRRLRVVPGTLNYGFLIGLVIVWNLVPFIERLSPGVSTPKRVLRRLRDLNDKIEAQVTYERGGVPLQANSLFTLSFGPKRSHSYQTLNERDIEKHLLEIFSLIQRIPRFASRPDFVIIFDELDKIQPHTNFTLQEQDEADRPSQPPAATPPVHEISSFEIERERQQRILGLVSNLKHFFTTCPAKFIFIAGREMFDASLADVSDRHFFMGSVFNQVIHVPSFLSDNSDDRLPDITSLTEEYLCRFLLPKRLWGERPELRTYYSYLKDELVKNDHPQALQLREKIIYQLHNFVTYVTYRSNGAPKKITKTIERFLVKLDQANPSYDHPDITIVGKSRQSFYLQLGYYDQYSFDIITYIGGPLIFSLNRAIKDFGDKILVSSAFLLDHIYKFHGHGFSWRNLELLPEIVDINRAPQLRELISSMMNFLSKSDVVQLGGGLYDFKFMRRITEEISFLSKVSEYESAAFNFTLDESLALKRHFQRKLRQLLKTYNDYPNKKDGHFVNSISYARMILGDLHFYDGDLDSAILEYMEAVQVLRAIKPEELKVNLLLLAVRNMLKLGLAFEKRRSYDSALAAYGRVVDLVGDFFHRSLAPEGSPSSVESSIFQSVHLIYQPIFAHLALSEKIPRGGAKRENVNNAVHEFGRILDAADLANRPQVEASFLNRLSDVVFFKNGPATEEEEAYCFGDGALCSKNEQRTELRSAGRHLPCLACSLSHQALGKILELNKSAKFSHPWLPIRILRSLAYHHPFAARIPLVAEIAGLLSDIGDTFLSCSYKEEIRLGFLSGVTSAASSPANRFGPQIVALTMAWSQTGKKGPRKIEEALAYFCVASLLYRLIGNNYAAAQELTKVLWVFRAYLQNFNLKDSEMKLLEKWLDKRVLQVILQENYRCHETTHRLEIEKLKEILEEKPGERWQKDLVNLGRISINSSVAEALVLFEEIKLSQKDSNELIPFDTRNSPFSMFHSVYSRIHNLRFRSRLNLHNIRALGLIGGTPFTLQRYFGRTKASFQEEAMKLAQDALELFAAPEGFKAGSPTDCPQATGWDYIEFLICDSLYCSHEISRLMAIYGSTYMASHSMKASAHRTLSLWCDIFYSYLQWLRDLNGKKIGARGSAPREEDARERLEKILQSLIGQADLVDLRPNYHADLAVGHYRAAIEVHSEGKAYFELLEKMYYLTEDFSDQLEHFCAALERYQINSGAVDSIITKLETRISLTSVFSANSYLNGGWSKDTQKESSETMAKEAPETVS